MTDAKLDHPAPYTEAEYFALGVTDARIELIDGSLWSSPSPGMPHQGICWQVLTALLPGARAAGLRGVMTINLRLGPERVLNPDVVVGQWDRLGLFAEASGIALVAEVGSPHTTCVDRLLKRHLYAAAGIDWYLLVEPALPDWATVTVRLLHREGDQYVEAAVAQPGETLVSAEPFPFEMHTTDLLDF
ncbi:Uma2 family endonuclease [Actinoplanes bogorensis]|uniref:Uma2 family endonuclease n=1 Tax=Paractinoplanes bogorensis TaxID=1610840 RepID=A0ABS5YMK5_9ACTN|nr:Uma2 family endonuclease [Actinoplanes bogorensis]MBU2664613.1 Uma2 family endonuclease [Actinoplanes bogorensis]